MALSHVSCIGCLLDCALQCQLCGIVSNSMELQDDTFGMNGSVSIASLIPSVSCFARVDLHFLIGVSAAAVDVELICMHGHIDILSWIITRMCLSYFYDARFAYFLFVSYVGLHTHAVACFVHVQGCQHAIIKGTTPLQAGIRCPTSAPAMFCQNVSGFYELCVSKHVSRSLRFALNVR